MKKLPYLLSLIIIVGCNANKPKSSSTDIVALDTVAIDTTGKISMVDSAKMMLDSSYFYLRKGVKNNMSSDAISKKAEVFLNKYSKIYSKLSPADTAEIYQYRLNALTN